MIARVGAALRLRKKLAISVMLSVFSVAWLVVLVPQAGAVGIFTARGNNKLFGALVIGGALDSNSEAFKLTTMAAAEGSTVAVTSPASTGATSGAAASASSSVTTGSLIPIGQVKFIIKTATAVSANSAGDSNNGSITYSDASVLNLGSDFAGLTALSTIATADGARFRFGGGPTTSSTVCAALASVTDGVQLADSATPQTITFVFQVANTNALAMGGAGFNFSNDATATCPFGGLTRADGVNQTETGIPTTTTTTTTTTSTTTTTTTQVVPTVGNWGMTLLGLTFLGAMAWMLRARRSFVRS